ncbi:HAD hydrolase-like protein [Porcipelethomonas sp.]
MKIKGVIFDMDGLMLDTEKLLLKFWIKSANEFGFGP